MEGTQIFDEWLNKCMNKSSSDQWFQDSYPQRNKTQSSNSKNKTKQNILKDIVLIEHVCLIY